MKIASKILSQHREYRKSGLTMTIDEPVFFGTHYEMGFQQGKQYSQSIRKGIQALLDSDVIKENKPKFLPQGLFFLAAKQRAKKLIDKDILKYFPKQADRLRGIADGASIDLSSILRRGKTLLRFPDSIIW